MLAGSRVMSETVLITGAFGLVGLETVRRFAADGRRVVAAAHRSGWKRYPMRVVAPLARQFAERHAAYRKVPGRYADVWGVLRARFGETVPDTAKTE